MKRLTFFSLILILCSMFIVGCTAVDKIDYSIDMTPRKISVTEDSAKEAVVSAIKPAVVGLLCEQGVNESVGSGVAVSSGGYIVTNNHVVENSNSIRVYFANKQTSSASIVWSDPSLDLAIIKCQKTLPYLEMSSSSLLSAGQDVLAVGTPLSLQFRHTVTKGIVSALNRTIEVSNSGGASTFYQNLIQHDASINPGNSGGPLLNLRGQVVGINTLKANDAEGLGFATPIEVIYPIIQKLSLGATLDTPYFGIYGYDSSIASFYGKTFNENGVYVLNVAADSPAEKAGLKIGDVITKIGEDDISTMLSLRVSIFSHSKGDSTIVHVTRGDEKLSCEVSF